MISPYSLNQFLISSTPSTRKRVKKAKKSKESRIVVSRQFDFTRKSKDNISVAKNIEFIEELGVTVGSNGLITINGPDEASLGESVRLSRERPIGDGASTVSHIARFEETCRLIRPLDFNPTIAINLYCYNSVDGRL